MANIENALVLRMEASLAKFERQMSRARQTGSGTARDIETRFDRMGQRMGQSSQRAASGLQRIMNISGSGRFVLQNTAAQLGDIAVQLEGGAAKSRVLAQQLPQILGGFGALGGVLGVVAPLLGTVAAVGIPLAAMFLMVGRDSEDAAEKVATFADKLKDAQGALDRANAAMVNASAAGLDELRERYGEITKEVTDLADALFELEQRTARIKVGNVIEDVIGGRLTRSEKEIDDAFRLLGNLEGRAAQFNQLLDLGASAAQIESFRQELGGGFVDALTDARAIVAEVEKFAAELNISTEAGRALAQSIQAAKEAASAGDFAAVADRLKDAQIAAREAGISIDGEILPALIEGESVARQMAKNIADGEAAADGTAGAARGIVGPISDAADEAARLSGNLVSAMAALAQVTAGIETAQRRAANQLRIKQGTIGDPAGRAAGLQREEYNEDSGKAAYLAIRGGRTGVLERLSEESDRLAQGAADIAAAEAQLREAEKSFAESLRSSSSGGKGGGGGASDAQRELESFKTSLQAFRTEEQSAAAALADLQASFDRFGATIQDDPQLMELYAQGVEELRGRMEEASRGVTDFGRQMANTFPTITQLFDDANGAMQRLISSLADRAWQRGLEVLFSGFGGGNSGGAGGGLFGGRIIPGILHDGGTAGIDGYGHGRSVPAALFANAPRYHNGTNFAGLRPNEVPAILERGETVIPKGKGSVSRIEVIPSPYFDVTVDGRAQNVAGRMDAMVARGLSRTNGQRLQNYQRRGTN